jgi:hypothetical protein
MKNPTHGFARIAIAGGLLLSTSIGASAAVLFSGYYVSTIAGPVAGERATIIEGIFYDTLKSAQFAPAANVYDYQFFVFNTGTVAIHAFGGGIGAPGAVTYNSNNNPGGFGPFLPVSGPVLPNLPAYLTNPTGPGPGKPFNGGWEGPVNPYGLGYAINPYSPLFPGTIGKLESVYQYWGFETSGLYALGWYELPGRGGFNPGTFTEFDLMSRFGPVAGGAFMDPPMTSVYDIGWLGGDYAQITTPSISDPQTYGMSCTPEPQCYSIPSMDDFPPGSWSAFGAPEPSTWAMMTLGFAGLAFAGFRRARPATAQRAKVLHA